MTVWYVAYGSNLDRERLMCYLAGGTPAGSVRRNPGARDATPPIDERVGVIDYPLYTARWSSTWGEGGIAFVGRRRLPGAVTYARKWRITLDQLVDVVAQENVVDRSQVSLDEAAIREGRAFTAVPGGWYGLVVPCDPVDGTPSVTFTLDIDMGDEPFTRPAPAYVETMRRGLRQMGLGPAEIDAYLARVPGIGGAP